MRTRSILTLSLTCLSFSNIYSQPESAYVQPIASPLNGFWSASIDLGPIQIPISLSLNQDPEGNLTGLFYCLEQGLTDLPLEEISFENDLLNFELKSLKATFSGTLCGSKISGHFTQSMFPFPITFKPVPSKPISLKRPQEPVAPYPYLVEEAAYENKEANATLSGTLTLPNGEGPFPAVLLVAGSGPNDRNETLLGHKPFLVLADHLTRCGIAVLRSDKRGVGKSTGNYNTATTQDFSDDAIAGVEYLKSHPKIDSFNMGLIGHSEGGLVAPIVAVQSNDVSFIVLLGGPSVTGAELLYEQGALIERSMGVSGELIAKETQLSREMFEIVIHETNASLAESQLKQLLSTYFQTLPEKLKLELSEKFDENTFSIHTQAAIDQINTPWFRYFLTYDPVTSLRQVKVPVLALNGELDLQVAPYQNLPPITKALKESKNPDFTILELPKHNHLFQVCKTGSLDEYGEIEETMSPQTLNTISDWILSKTQRSMP